ncbi:MAG: SRPBCC family protein [Bdellovibrionota bacterium]
MSKIYKLHKKQFLPISKEEAWSFFSNPNNLPSITPPKLGFKVENESPDYIYPGQVHLYTVRPLLGIPLTWMTEITHVEEGKFFVDEQRTGPYAIWHHEHHFRETEGGVEVEDLIHYKLPFWIFGDIANFLIVKRDLEYIFNYRNKILGERFGSL